MDIWELMRQKREVIIVEAVKTQYSWHMRFEATSTTLRKDAASTFDLSCSSDCCPDVTQSSNVQELSIAEGRAEARPYVPSSSRGKSLSSQLLSNFDKLLQVPHRSHTSADLHTRPPSMYILDKNRM
jgi:hypothetical protein